MLPPPPRSTLFPYTTLFRSSRRFFERQVANVTYHTQDRAFRIVRPHNSPNGRIVRTDNPERTVDRKSTRLNSSHPSISYAVFCLKKKKQKKVNCKTCHMITN